MKGLLPFAISLCLILANSLTYSAPAASSGERVHIRLHMPEIVRKHTHFHKVYKVLPPAIEPPVHHLPAALSPHGRPHVSLLGYTTTASGTGVMSPNLMQVMASAATPTLTPKYGPALFDSYNQETPTPTTTTIPTTWQTSDSGTESGSYFATAPATISGIGSSKSPQQQLLKQIFTPNILAAISASQQQKKKKHNSHIEIPSELEMEPEQEMQLEDNELLNNNFLAALEHEYFNKFGSGTRQRKKVHFRSNYRRPPPKKTSNYVQENEEEHFEDYPEEPYTTGYDGEAPTSFGQEADDDDGDAVMGYDSAAAFSGQSNGLSLMPTVDEFLSHENDPFYGRTYDDYAANSGTMSTQLDHNDWHSSPPSYAHSYARPTKATPPSQLRLRPRRRPSAEFSSGMGSAGKVRYTKLTTRKKRKNRIKAKRYRM